MLRILITDDSAFAREALASLINEDPDMMVAGMAGSGEEAIKKAADLRPNLITMDLVMPDMDGVEATRRIMARHPAPIVLVSSTVTPMFTPTHFDALAVGAVDVVEKPDLRFLESDRRSRRKFLENLKAMSSVVTVTRRRANARSSRPPSVGSSTPPPEPSRTTPAPTRRRWSSAPARQLGLPREARVIVLGASTGGPPAIAQTLALLAADSPPVVVVQHMAPGFINGYVDWLGRQIGSAVRIAANGQRLEAGIVYLAPDDRHVEVTPYGRLLVYHAPPLRYHRPSVDVLFQSAASHFGKSAVGVLLTGMGDDGARGLMAMRREGAFTAAQDRQTSVVFGMPAAAANRGAVCWAASCEAIAEALHAVRHDARGDLGAQP